MEKIDKEKVNEEEINENSPKPLYGLSKKNNNYLEAAGISEENMDGFFAWYKQAMKDNKSKAELIQAIWINMQVSAEFAKCIILNSLIGIEFIFGTFDVVEKGMSHDDVFECAHGYRYAIDCGDQVTCAHCVICYDCTDKDNCETCNYDRRLEIRNKI